MSDPASVLTLDRDRAVLLVVDIQEKLAAAMPESTRVRAEKNVAILCEAARRLDFPVVVSEQYPRGLGPTTKAITVALEPIAERVKRIEKTEFSVCDNDGFQAIWDELGRDQWIVTGMEAHVCVYQTVRDLLGRGATVHVPIDAVTSRSKSNRRIAMGLIERAGAIPTSTEVIVFDLLKRAGGDDFKALSKLIR